MAIVLFFVGLLAAFVLAYTSATQEGEDKRGITAFPFLLLFAAAVARYLGF